jgi:autotransporter adhesin
MSSNVIHQAPSARRQASPSKRTTGNTSHSCFAVSLVAAAIALAACPAMAAGMVTAGSGAGVAVGATSSTTGANQVAVGPNARTDSTYSGNAGEASIAIGANAKTITEVGRKGAAVVFMDPLSYLFHTGNFGAGGIAIGKNSIGYNGSTVLGQHDYTGQIGDVNVNKQGDASNSYENLQYGFGATSVGYNSYTAGQYATSIGAYNVNSANYYPGGTNTVNGNSTVSQGFGATIIGSFNSNESRSSQSAVSGMANSLVGVANRVSNSSGALVFGAANQITNSLQNDDTLSRTPILPSSPVEFADTLRELVSQSNGGGSTLAIGGANTADWTNETAIIGVGNTVKGGEGAPSAYNLFTGFANTGDSVHHVTVIGSGNSVSHATKTIVIGDNRNLDTVTGAVVIGNATTATPVKAANNSVTIGSDSLATFQSGVAIGNTASSSGSNAIAMGTNSKAAMLNTVAIGNTASASYMGGVALGNAANSTGTNATAIGSTATASGSNAIAMGTNSKAATLNTVAIGNTATATSMGGVAIGNTSTASSANATAVGTNTIAKGASSVAIGNNATATTTGGVAIGSGSVADTWYGLKGYDPSTKTISTDTSATWMSTASAVSVGDADEEITRQITGVAAGWKDTDAVNVAQLKAITAASSTKVDTKGPNLSVDTTRLPITADPSTSPPASTYTVTLSQDLTDMHSATFSSDSSPTTTVINTNGVTITGGSSGTVSITSAGLDNGGNKITNVAAGTVSATSNEAINGAQLHETNVKVQNNTTNIATNRRDIDNNTANIAANRTDINNLQNQFSAGQRDLKDRINRAGATAAALAGLHPQDYDEDHKVSASLGLGVYHGTQALAVGLFVRPTENLMFNVGGAFASNDHMLNLGVSYRFGDNSMKKKSPQELQAEVTSLKTENTDLSARLATADTKLSAANTRLDSQSAELRALKQQIADIQKRLK